MLNFGLTVLWPFTPSTVNLYTAESSFHKETCYIQLYFLDGSWEYCFFSTFSIATYIKLWNPKDPRFLFFELQGIRKQKFESSLWYADSSLHNKGPVVYMVHYLWIQNFNLSVMKKLSIFWRTSKHNGNVIVQMKTADSTPSAMK
jgi:hypothetical protein